MAGRALALATNYRVLLSLHFQTDKFSRKDETRRTKDGTKEEGETEEEEEEEEQEG